MGDFVKVKASNKLLAIVFFASIAAAIVLAALTVADCIKYSDYIKIEAVVTSVNTDSSLTNAGGNTSVEKYAVCSYNIDGESHSKKYRLGLFNTVGEGDTIKIKVNPDNPDEIADNYALKVKGYAALFFLSFGVVMTFLLRKAN